ncbi:MAG TPA: hypothetical protein VE844_15305, partial [Gammaproteobacteria bacterium]|nr:hypothetical protein [Gammaproteobacteria bacterium]
MAIFRAGWFDFQAIRDVPMLEFSLERREINLPPFWAFAHFCHLALVGEVFWNSVVKLDRIGI